MGVRGKESSGRPRAVGFNQARGDTLNVANAAFTPPEKEAVADAPIYENQKLISLLLELARYAVIAGALFYAICLNVADISLAKLWQGLPRLANWASRAWPPDISELGILSYRAAETVAMATVGVSFGALISVPICLPGSANTGVVTVRASARLCPFLSEITELSPSAVGMPSNTVRPLTAACSQVRSAIAEPMAPT